MPSARLLPHNLTRDTDWESEHAIMHKKEEASGRNETKAGRNELTFVEAGNEFVDDVLQILVQSHGRVRFGLVQRRLAHGTEGPAVHELEVFDVLQEAGATEEVESRAVDQSRGIDQIPAAQEAGDPLVQVNESRTFHSLLRQRRQAASHRRRHRCPRIHGHEEGFRCTCNRRRKEREEDDQDKGTGRLRTQAGGGQRGTRRPTVGHESEDEHPVTGLIIIVIVVNSVNDAAAAATVTP